MKIQAFTYPKIQNKEFLNKQEPVSIMKNEPRKISGLSNIYYYPVNFGKKKRTTDSVLPQYKSETTDFRPVKFDNITCPACGKTMLPQKKFSEIADLLHEIPPEKYLDFLDKYKNYMRPVEESVFNELYELSKRKNASKDIRTLLVQLRDTKLPVLQKAQMHKVNEMRKLANNLPPEEQKILLREIESLSKEIKKTKSTSPFRRKVMIDKISKINIKNPKYYEALQKIAKDFPTSKDMNSAWIVKYSGKNKMDQPWDSYHIALRMLSSSIPNTDHIVAYDINSNHNDITNYIAMHNGCNGQKSNKTFVQWLNEDKENRINYIKEYFQQVDAHFQKYQKGIYKEYTTLAPYLISKAANEDLNIFDDDLHILSTQQKEMIDKAYENDFEDMPPVDDAAFDTASSDI